MTIPYKSFSPSTTSISGEANNLASIGWLIVDKNSLSYEILQKFRFRCSKVALRTFCSPYCSARFAKWMTFWSVRLSHIVSSHRSTTDSWNRRIDSWGSWSTITKFNITAAATTPAIFSKSISISLLYREANTLLSPKLSWAINYWGYLRTWYSDRLYSSCRPRRRLFGERLDGLTFSFASFHFPWNRLAK